MKERARGRLSLAGRSRGARALDRHLPGSLGLGYLGLGYLGLGYLGLGYLGLGCVGLGPSACGTPRGETAGGEASAAAGVAVSASSSAAPSPSADGPAPPPHGPCPALDAALTEEKLMRHLENLMQVAKQGDGTRSRSSGGFHGSVAYVEHTLHAAGLSPRRVSFEVPTFEVLGPGELAWVSPEARALAPARHRLQAGDFLPLRGSPPGAVTAEVAPVAVALGLGNTSTSGCSPADFDDGHGHSLVAGRVALLQRGSCPFVEKIRNAEAAGARAALVFNQGDTPLRRGLLEGGLDGRGTAHDVGIPALFITTGAAEAMLARLASTPLLVRVGADTAWRLERVPNVVLDIPGERDGEIFALGAHLDSVDDGPGMNDNASGTAALLEIALTLAACRPARRLRFFFWGAEEEGLLGSRAYVTSLSDTERRALRGYVNLDMLAAPNHAFMLTDGDGSRFGEVGPAGSGELEAFFRADFTAHGHPLVESRYMGRSDDKPFFDAGVGVVMLGAGYDGQKTPEQAALFGGVAGKPFDPCYHRACDDLGNVNAKALLVITASVARAVHHFGVRGEGL